MSVRPIPFLVASLVASLAAGTTAPLAAAGWTNLGRSPSARISHASAYDSARSRLVLFGGWDGSGNQADTWERDATSWVDVTSASGPDARYAHAMVYDAARGRVVLFGGYNDFIGALGDTWEWDGDLVGDVCDLDDGLIFVGMSSASTVGWQLERGMAAFNVYREEMRALRTTGVYTQDPLVVTEAARFCGETTGSLVDPYAPGPGTVVDYLATGLGSTGESSLGTRSDGTVRPNDHPCP